LSASTDPVLKKGEAKIERVTSRPSDGYKLTIDDLEDRMAMLQDFRAKLSFVKRDLALLLRSLPQKIRWYCTSQCTPAQTVAA